MILFHCGGGEVKNIDEWQLFHIAQALTRAKRLEKNREVFHEELYSMIHTPTVQYGHEHEPSNIGGLGTKSVESQAIRIIELKERYDKKIQVEYDRHVRWRNLLEWLDNNEKHIMIRYFEKKKSVQPKIINRLLSKIEKQLDLEEKRIEQERTEQSTAEFRIYQELTKAFRKTSVPTESEDKQQYIINGQFVYMTQDEYTDHSLQKN